MNIQPKEIEQLIDRFNRGVATAAEEQRLEQCIEAGLVEPEQLRELDMLGKHLKAMQYAQGENAMRHNFQQMLAKEKRSIERSPGNLLRQFFAQQWTLSPALQLAIIAIVLIAGIGIGTLLQPANNESQQADIAQMANELRSVKEMMMLTLLEKESTNDRLKAVKISEELNDASEQVTQALLQTLNNDKNVSVRLAALEALQLYTDDPQVREGLIYAIRYQESPLVQVAMAELMVALQEKRSVEPLEELLESERTPPEVKEQIRSNIKVLL